MTDTALLLHKISVTAASGTRQGLICWFNEFLGTKDTKGSEYGVFTFTDDHRQMKCFYSLCRFLSSDFYTNTEMYFLLHLHDIIYTVTLIRPEEGVWVSASQEAGILAGSKLKLV